MTNEATYHDQSDIDHSASGHSCAHCDAAEDHHALDVKGIVDSFRGSLNAAAIARAGVAIVVTVLAVLWAPLTILGGASSWIVATLAGVGMVTASRGKYGAANAIIFGVIASAAVMPIVALVTATWTGGAPRAAFGAGAGWFLAVTIAESLRDRKLSALLIADSRDGEAAREGVMFGQPISPWVGLAWSVSTAVLFGLWVWVSGLLPLAVIPLVPLQVTLALLSRKGHHGAP